MPKRFVASQVPEYLSILKSTLIGLRDISKGERDLSSSPSKAEWSAHQTLAHLCSCQDVWAYSIYVILAADEPQLYPIHPREMAKVMDYEALSFSSLFSYFQEGRRQLLRVLGTVDQTGWTQEAIIKGRVHSLFSQVRRMALHEREHWEQFEKAIGDVDWFSTEGSGGR